MPFEFSDKSSWASDEKNNRQNHGQTNDKQINIILILHSHVNLKSKPKKIPLLGNEGTQVGVYLQIFIHITPVFMAAVFYNCHVHG